MTRKRCSPPPEAHPVAANDNLPPLSKEVEAALDRIARAIGRQNFRLEQNQSGVQGVGSNRGSPNTQSIAIPSAQAVDA